MSLCPEAKLRSEMSDAEFWSHVFSIPEHDVDYWAAHSPDIYALTCARCGRTVEVDGDSVEGRDWDAFCDDCADEHLPDLEEVV